MGTLAAALARKGIETPENAYRAEVEGDIENVRGVLRITQIRVDYHLTVGAEKQRMPERLSPPISCPARLPRA